MKNLTLILILLFVSCQKDKIYLNDKKNDCQDCSIYYQDLNGNNVSMSKSEIMDKYNGNIYNYCEFLKYHVKQNTLIDKVGNPIGYNPYFKCR